MSRTASRPLAKRIAVVTGGATGIGWGIAKALADAGCQVVIGGRRIEKLVEAAESYHGPIPIRHHQLDVADRSGTRAFFDWVQDRIGPPDILVHAAGINIRRRSMTDMAPHEWDEVLAVNATGAYNVLHAALPEMRRRRTGLVVLISSVSGKRAYPLGGVAYCASKFALTALATAAGNEAAADEVRVTTIFPGEVNTPILDVRPEPVPEERRRTMLQPDDLGQIVRDLALLPPHVHIPELVVKPLSQEYL